MKSTFTISGIHCSSCVSLISMDLEDLDGVEHMSIDPKTGEATIEYDEDIVSLDEIKKTICEAGEYEIV